MKRRWKGGRKPDGKGESTNKDSTIICFECKKPGHMKADCPMLKKKGKKGKRALAATTQSDDEKSSSNEEAKP